MKVLSTTEQSRCLDELAGAYGLSNSQLMDTAGYKASQWLLRKFGGDTLFQVFCGPGHNGGDAFVVAFYLIQAGREVQVFACESSNSLFNEKKRKLQKRGLKIQTLETWLKQKKLNTNNSKLKPVLIDGLFGVGLSRPLKGVFKKLVQKMNQTKLPRISLDVPSGLCADTGQVLGLSVKANYTLSFALEKPGFYLNEGPQQTGKLVVLPLEYPKELLNKVCNTVYLIEKKDFSLPSYKATANKSHKGWSLIVAGREGMWGCGLLACQSAYAVGSGYVSWASSQYPYKKSLSIPEVLLNRLSNSKLFDKKTAIGAGPGLGFSTETQNFILKLKKLKLPVVLDADAITLLAKLRFSQKNFIKLNKNFLLTPHAGELSRLLNVPAKTIEADRLLYATKGAKKCNSWLLLKGLHPVLSDGKKQWIIPYSHPALGKAGTGDVLTGILTGLLAQKLSILKASALGVFLQGETARLWIQKGKASQAFSARHIIEELPFVLSQF